MHILRNCAYSFFSPYISREGKLRKHYQLNAKSEKWLKMAIRFPGRSEVRPEVAGVRANSYCSESMWFGEEKRGELSKASSFPSCVQFPVEKPDCQFPVIKLKV